MLIDIDTLESLAASACIVDTRKREDYDRAHIPGAIHFDNFGYANEDTRPSGLEKAVADWKAMFEGVGIGPTGTFVFYDVGSENHGPRPAVMLRFLGNSESRVLEGGLFAWVRAGRPVSQDPARRPALSSGAFPLPMDMADVATVDDVVAALDGGVRLLDVRDDEEYEGRKSQGNPRLGRIPGAAHIPWSAFGVLEGNVPDVVGTGKYGDAVVAGLRPPEDIRRQLLDLGLTESDPVILYCQRSHRATAAYVALKSAGFERVKVYLGSFREWSRREDLPVEPPSAYLP